MSQQLPFDETDVPDAAPASYNDRGGDTALTAVANIDLPPDLSAEIARSIARRPGEQVTCRRVGEHHYRCNWWTRLSAAKYDNPGMKGSLVTASRISQSEFLHVTRAQTRLEIRVETRTAAPRGFWFGP